MQNRGEEGFSAEGLSQIAFLCEPEVDGIPISIDMHTDGTDRNEVDLPV